MFKRNTPNNILIFGAGLAAGWIVKQLFDSPEFEPQKRQVLATAKELRQRLSDSDEADRVRGIFGKTTRDFTQIYQDTKENVLEEIENLRLSLDDLDKNRYVEIVTNIIKSMKNDQDLPEDQLKKLSQSLVKDFEKITSNKK